MFRSWYSASHTEKPFRLYVSSVAIAFTKNLG